MYYLIGEFSNKIEYESYKRHNYIAISFIKTETSNSKTADFGGGGIAREKNICQVVRQLSNPVTERLK